MKKEKDLFEGIYGYKDIKQTLAGIIDVLNNTEKYKKLGCTIPHGLMLYGQPGTGKTTFSNAILKNVTNRKVFTINKTKSNGSFVKYLESVFNEAIKEQPSIILLDDLDKFAKSDDSVNQEEFVVVQSLLDKIKNKDVYVIATVNDQNLLPRSLRRSGRFDNIIEIETPSEEESKEIVKGFLSTKKLSKDVNLKQISEVLSSLTCADLEKVCNQAGLYAGYANKDEIGMDELIRAALEYNYETIIIDRDKGFDYSLNVAYHEAGHALVSELLEKNSISLITICKDGKSIEGFNLCNENENYYNDIEYMNNEIKVLLAGKAATEIIYNKCDTGAGNDIEKAIKIANRYVTRYSMFEFMYCIDDYADKSDNTKDKINYYINKILDEAYQETKKILEDNIDKLHDLAHELDKKKILFNEDIRRIINKNTSKHIL